jgi:hypothetical protein
LFLLLCKHSRSVIVINNLTFYRQQFRKRRERRKRKNKKKCGKREKKMKLKDYKYFFQL